VSRPTHACLSIQDSLDIHSGPCGGSDLSFRIDTEFALGFIWEYL
jgi:hypothetical protein